MMNQKRMESNSLSYMRNLEVPVPFKHCETCLAFELETNALIEYGKGSVYMVRLGCVNAGFCLKLFGGENSE